MAKEGYHFHGAKPPIFVCSTPKLIKPMTIIAVPFMRTVVRSGQYGCSLHSGLGRRHTPQADTLRLLLPRVEHARYNHESGRNDSLTRAEDEAACKQPTKTRAGRMGHERNRPYEDTYAAPQSHVLAFITDGELKPDAPHPLAHWEPLERKVLWVFERKIAEVYRKRVRVSCVTGRPDGEKH